MRIHILFFVSCVLFHSAYAVRLRAGDSIEPTGDEADGSNPPADGSGAAADGADSADPTPENSRPAETGDAPPADIPTEAPAEAPPAEAAPAEAPEEAAPAEAPPAGAADSVPPALSSDDAPQTALRSANIPPTEAAVLAADIKEAAERLNCSDVIHTFETLTAHEGSSGKSWLDSFKSLWASATKFLQKDSDKDASAALNSLSSALHNSQTLDFDTLHALASCDVDGGGRTILMKLVERGFIKSIENPLSWSIFSPKEFTELIHAVDKEGNNLLHLAVMARSTTVVQKVIYSLNMHITTEELRLFFDNVNQEGLKPIDVARQRGMPPDISSVMLEFYRTHYHGGGSKEQRDMMKSPPSPPRFLF